MDDTADLDAALDVIQNAKVQRPTVCNALDTALVHRAVAAQFLPRLTARLAADGVTFRADPAALAALHPPPATVLPAGPSDFDTEWRSSTRFTDGGQLGLGAEVAVSTQRLHARGPMGLRELTTYKWVIEGDYHIRP